jgi:hypothetical protein
VKILHFASRPHHADSFGFPSRKPEGTTDTGHHEKVQYPEKSLRQTAENHPTKINEGGISFTRNRA